VNQLSVSNNDNNSSVLNINYKPPIEKTNKQNKKINKNCRLKGNAESKFDSIVNLSDRKLTREETDLLCKGLKFIPTKEKVNVGELLADIEEWSRRLRLVEFFGQDNQEREETNNIRRRTSGRWTPEKGRAPFLDLYIDNVKNDIVGNLMRRKEKNITTKEHRALLDLMYDENIVIRPADKGSGIVIMNKDKYIEQIEDNLNSNETYIKINDDETTKINNKLKRFVEKLIKEGKIDKELKPYLLPKDIMNGKVQGNPKIHKEGAPLRVIINGRNHPTRNIAEFVEKQLENHVHQLPSFIQDTSDFIRKIGNLPSPLPDNCIMFCMDVKALYPSVPRKEARIAIEKALNNSNNKEVDTGTILEMMDMVLENNTFTFNKKNYVQVEGTAIGSKLGCNYACTYMGAWEKILLEKSELIPMVMYRYIDDIWGIWTGSNESLLKFHTLANAIHPNIIVDLRTSTENIEFLDVCIIIKDGKLITDLFTKKTDKHLYLHADSSHPTYVKKSIPYGLTVRVRRICSEETSYQHERKNIVTNLKKRGYREKLINIEIKKAEGKTREELLKQKGRPNKNNKLPLSVVYSKSLPNIYKILKKNENVLFKDERLKKLYEGRIITSFKRDQNLKDILVHRRHNNMFYKKINGTKNCGKNCAICPYMVEKNEFHDKNGNKFQVQGEIDCKTTNVVYGIGCTECERIVYVGETGDRLYQRMLLNLSRIRTNYPDPVAKHFNSENHTVQNMQIIGIERTDKEVIYRRVKESLWIKKLGTVQPHGLNLCT
jgi:hypothetical protein